MNARVREVAAVFLRLGFTAFGGPAAHIAMMRDEVVRRRRWVSDQQFLDLVGATNLIPGPNSTEMAIHLGYTRAGWPGLIVAGASFIVPAVGIVLALAWAYVRYGAVPQGQWLLYGVKPVIIAVVVQALWVLGRTAVRRPLPAAIAVAVFALYLAGVNELALLAAGGVVGILTAARHPATVAGLVPLGVLWQMASAAVSGLPAVIDVSLARMFAIFVKIGAVLYGSGYVLLAFLHGDFVARLGWLSDRQLLDAVAIGQFTPGPVFTTATFIGYVLGGTPGALLATVGIFLPSFVFVAASHPLIPRMRRSPLTGALLDGVNAAALALMAGVTLQLGRAALVDVWTVVLALAAAAILLWRPVNSAWLVLGGALAGLLLRG